MIAVDQADRIQAFVLVGELGVRHVIEPHRQGMLLSDAITQLGGEVEQDARPQLFAVETQGFELAGMGRAADGERKEGPAPQAPIPVDAKIE